MDSLKAMTKNMFKPNKRNYQLFILAEGNSFLTEKSRKIWRRRYRESEGADLMQVYIMLHSTRV